MKIRAFLEGYKAKMITSTIFCFKALIWAEMGFILALGAAAAQSCSAPIQYVPVETTKVVTDSIYIKEHIIERDTCYLKDYVTIEDTLVLESKNAKATAWVDSTTLKGTLLDKPIKLVYQDRINYRDSTIIKEIPKEVEVTKEVKVIPLFYRICGLITVLESFYILWKIIMKIYIKK